MIRDESITGTGEIRELHRYQPLTDARASVTGWSYDLAGRLLRKNF